MNYQAITYPDINNGLGLRVTLWLSGCDHRCKGCQNPQTWDKNSGALFNSTVKIRLFDILSLNYISGLTISGGDGLYKDNLNEVYDLLSEIRMNFGNSKNIWLYTGYVWEEIIKNDDMMVIVKMCDVIVDGKYIEEQRSLSKFKGSLNQRIIDVKNTIANSHISCLI